MPNELVFNYGEDGRVLRVEKTDGGVCLSEFIDGEVCSVFVSHAELFTILLNQKTSIVHSITSLPDKTIDQTA